MIVDVPGGGDDAPGRVAEPGAWGRYHNDFGGQMLVLFIIAVAACEAAIALALILMLFRRRGSLDIAVWQDLREANQPPFVDRGLPEDRRRKARPRGPRCPRPDASRKSRAKQTDYRPSVRMTML